MSARDYPAARPASKELPTHERFDDGQCPKHKQQRNPADPNCLRRNAIAILVAQLEMLRDAGRVSRSESSPYRYVKV